MDRKWHTAVPFWLAVVCLAVPLWGQGSEAVPGIASRYGWPSDQGLHPGLEHRRMGAGVHRLFRWRSATPGRDAALRVSGARVVGSLGDGTRLVWLPGVALSGMSEASGVEGDLLPVPPEQKLSPALADGDNGHAVVEFHADVDPVTAQAVLVAEGLDRQPHPALLGQHRLVRASLEQLARLARWDEVAYVFPASTELILAEPIEACPGPPLDDGSVGQLVVRVGEGWDGPGRGGVDLGYSLTGIPARLGEPGARREVERALAEWRRVAAIRWRETGEVGEPRTLEIRFSATEHGDGYPFDGPGRVLAHTFYPPPNHSEPRAGDVHLDLDEPWNLNSDLDLYSVVLHELGHALGLGHSDVPSAVMYPYYRRATRLTSEDEQAILAMYASASGGALVLRPEAYPATTSQSTLPLAGSVEGGQPPYRVVWSSAGQQGEVAAAPEWRMEAMPLQVGDNEVVLTASDAAQATAERRLRIRRTVPAPTAAPAPTPAPAPAPTPETAIRLMAPSSSGTYVTAASALTLRGAASDPSGLLRVEWSGPGSARGEAAGRESWTTPAIPLPVGRSQLRVTAIGRGGGQASATMEVTRTAASDRTPPTLAIDVPGSSTHATTEAAITLRGRASDTGGSVRVTWAIGSGPETPAMGVPSWTAGPVPLLRGVNLIVVRAQDEAGNVSRRSVTVTRR